MSLRARCNLGPSSEKLRKAVPLAEALTAYCLLLTAYCLLLTAYCLLLRGAYGLLLLCSSAVGRPARSQGVTPPRALRSRRDRRSGSDGPRWPRSPEVNPCLKEPLGPGAARREAFRTRGARRRATSGFRVGAGPIRPLPAFPWPPVAPPRIPTAQGPQRGSKLSHTHTLNA